MAPLILNLSGYAPFPEIPADPDEWFEQDDEPVPGGVARWFDGRHWRVWMVNAAGYQIGESEGFRSERAAIRRQQRMCSDIVSRT